MGIKKLRPWLLPLMFLLGFMVAWGFILVDRQMMIDSQAKLSQELKRTKLELKLHEVMGDFEDDWQEIVIWNEEHKIEPPFAITQKEIESGQVDK